MVGRVRVDMRGLRRFQQQVNQLDDRGIERIIELATKRVAAQFLRDVIQLTPVGEYPNDKRIGGTLRRGWTANTQAEAESDPGPGNINSALNDLEVRRRGDVYTIEIINPVEYASFINYGHRTRSGGFVQGRFFLEIAADQVERKAPRAIEQIVVRELRRAFGAN